MSYHVCDVCDQGVGAALIGPRSAVSKLLAPALCTVLAVFCLGASGCAPNAGPTTSANSGASGDQRAQAAARGRAYAQQACASCHATDPGQQSADPKAPTFEAIAKTPGMTIKALKVWLRTSHPTMPNLVIDSDKVDDLSAYIMSLEK